MEFCNDCYDMAAELNTKMADLESMVASMDLESRMWDVGLQAAQAIGICTTCAITKGVGPGLGACIGCVASVLNALDDIAELAPDIAEVLSLLAENEVLALEVEACMTLCLCDLLEKMAGSPLSENESEEDPESVIADAQEAQARIDELQSDIDDIIGELDGYGDELDEYAA